MTSVASFCGELPEAVNKPIARLGSIWLVRPSPEADRLGLYIKGKYALNWTRLSCHRFVANRVRLSLFILAYNLGTFLRRLCLPKAVRHWSLRSVQVKLIKMGGRLVRALPSIDLSVVRGVGSSTVVPGSVGSYLPVIAGAKLGEGTTTILPRGRERSRESACLQCAFIPLAGDPKTTKMDKKHGSRQELHPLSDRPEIEWPCST